MKRSSAHIARLERALIASAATLIVVVLLDKLGIGLRPLRLESPASWAAVVRNMPTFLAFSLLVGGLFYFFPRSNA